MQHDVEALFPEFDRFVKDTGLLEKAKGALAANLPRILGQGQTKAIGLNLPPAPIERKLELINLKLPADMVFPEVVIKEIEGVKALVEKELSELRSEEGIRRLASQAIERISDKGIEFSGMKDNFFYANRLLLIPDRKRQSWSWSMTPHYPVISRIPADVLYLERAFFAAEEKMRMLLLPHNEFEKKLALSWEMARYFSSSDDNVLIVDVARMYLVASQDNRFWTSPRKQNFVDHPDAAFIINFLHWKVSESAGTPQFEITPATLHQAHGKDAKVFFLPMDQEGTQTRPYVYMKKRF